LKTRAISVKHKHYTWHRGVGKVASSRANSANDKHDKTKVKVLAWWMLLLFYEENQAEK